MAPVSFKEFFKVCFSVNFGNRIIFPRLLNRRNWSEFERKWPLLFNFHIL